MALTDDQKAAILQGIFGVAGAGISAYGQGQAAGAQLQASQARTGADVRLQQMQAIQNALQGAGNQGQAGYTAAAGLMGGPTSRATDMAQYRTRSQVAQNPIGKYMPDSVSSALRASAPAWSEGNLASSVGQWDEALAGMTRGGLSTPDYAQEGFGEDLASGLASRVEGARAKDEEREASRFAEEKGTINSLSEKAVQELALDEATKGGGSSWWQKLLGILGGASAGKKLYDEFTSDGSETQPYTQTIGGDSWGTMQPSDSAYWNEATRQTAPTPEELGIYEALGGGGEPQGYGESDYWTNPTSWPEEEPWWLPYVKKNMAEQDPWNQPPEYYGY